MVVGRFGMEMVDAPAGSVTSAWRVALITLPGRPLHEEEVEAHVNRTEIANLEYYGYGVSSFVLSLIETADGMPPKTILKRIQDLELKQAELDRLKKDIKSLLAEKAGTGNFVNGIFNNNPQ